VISLRKGGKGEFLGKPGKDGPPGRGKASSENKEERARKARTQQSLTEGGNFYDDLDTLVELETQGRCGRSLTRRHLERVQRIPSSLGRKREVKIREHVYIPAE